MHHVPSFSSIATLLGLAFAASAQGADPPILKSGLWEVLRTSTQQPERKIQTMMCLDDSVQAQMRDFGMGAAKEMCAQTVPSIEGNRMTVTATCKLGQTTLKSSAVTTFNGNTSYHMDSSATYDPPLGTMKDMKMSIDAKWVGACKPGQQPGDITLETGQTVNVKQMMGNKKQ